MTTYNPFFNSETTRVQCCRTRKCGWRGTRADYVWRPKADGSGSTAVCPQCGHHEFYDIDRLTTLQQQIMDAVRSCSSDGKPVATHSVHAHLRHSSPFLSVRTVRSQLAVLASQGHLQAAALPGAKLYWTLAPSPNDH